MNGGTALARTHDEADGTVGQIVCDYVLKNLLGERGLGPIAASPELAARAELLPWWNMVKPTASTSNELFGDEPTLTFLRRSSDGRAIVARREPSLDPGHRRCVRTRAVVGESQQLPVRVALAMNWWCWEQPTVLQLSQIALKELYVNARQWQKRLEDEGRNCGQDLEDLLAAVIRRLRNPQTPPTFAIAHARSTPIALMSGVYDCLRLIANWPYTFSTRETSYALARNGAQFLFFLDWPAKIATPDHVERVDLHKPIQDDEAAADARWLAGYYRAGGRKGVDQVFPEPLRDHRGVFLLREMRKRSSFSPPPVDQDPSPLPPVETPVADTPVAETPVAETPPVQAPVTETPVIETLPVPTAIVETPVVETPPIKIRVIETPIVETPPTEIPPAIESSADPVQKTVVHDTPPHAPAESPTYPSSDALALPIDRPQLTAPRQPQSIPPQPIPPHPSPVETVPNPLEFYGARQVPSSPAEYDSFLQEPEDPAPQARPEPLTHNLPIPITSPRPQLPELPRPALVPVAGLHDVVKEMYRQYAAQDIQKFDMELCSKPSAFIEYIISSRAGSVVQIGGVHVPVNTFAETGVRTLRRISRQVPGAERYAIRYHLTMLANRFEEPTALPVFKDLRTWETLIDLAVSFESADAREWVRNLGQGNPRLPEQARSAVHQAMARNLEWLEDERAKLTRLSWTLGIGALVIFMAMLAIAGR